MPNVTFIRPELEALMQEYNAIQDCILGEVAIKKATTLYLPKPNEADTSDDNAARYEAYIKRAVFYNAVRKTLNGLVGQVFMRDPIVKLPSYLKMVETNASGTGLSLVQQAKKALADTLAYSRCGLLVDYPVTDGPASVYDIEEGFIRPTITEYRPQDIINWRVVDRGAEEILSLVVLREAYIYEDDGFEIKIGAQFRVLRLVTDLDNGGLQCSVEIWREQLPKKWDGLEKVSGNFVMISKVFPRDGNGKPLPQLPFTFVGSENNDAEPDEPNFYDMAALSIAHYRNSADYEESCFITGQPTPVITGLTSKWYEDVLNKRIDFGSRGGIPLPAGADAKLLQANEGTMLREAMQDKERQMVALGAKLIEQKKVQRTAFEAKMESTIEGSVLSSSAKNVEAAYLWALKLCAKFLAKPDTDIEFELNTDFDISRITPEERAATIIEWQAGAITFGEMRSVLRKSGSATEEDGPAKVSIEKDQKQKADLEAKAATKANEVKMTSKGSTKAKTVATGSGEGVPKNPKV